MYNMIDAVIIDTSAFVTEQCDFMGLSSAMLPSLFNLLEEKKIVLLSHPILQEEIKKHTKNSALLEKLINLKKSIARYKAVLPLIQISADETVSKIESLELDSKMVSAFEGFYKNAKILPYPKPETIFTQYFAFQPPFSESGEKKSEFPDAFVIEAIKQYLLLHSTSSVLVISSDSDWAKALSEVSRASLADSISQGMQILQSSENVIPIFNAVKKDIEKEVLFHAECECYELNGFEEVEDDLEITSVKVEELSDDIIPLKISETSVLLRTYATLKLSGGATVLDDSRSYWDKEDGKYLFVAYNNISFNNGLAEVECEVEIKFDPEDFEDSAYVESVKLNVRYNIEVTVDEDDVVYADPEQDASADAMDALEEYHRH